MPRFRIIVMSELDETFESYGKSEIAKEIQARLEMLDWDVTLRDNGVCSFSSKLNSKGRILIDVLL